MTDNRFKDADGTVTNPECGNSFSRSCSAGEVRYFSHNNSQNSGDIMCEACADHYGYEWNKGKAYPDKG